MFGEDSGDPYWVVEEVAEITQADLEQHARECDPLKGCEGAWSITEIRAGIRALAIGGPEVTSVTWLESGLSISVMGPSATFTMQEALTTANSV